MGYAVRHFSVPSSHSRASRMSVRLLSMFLLLLDLSDCLSTSDRWDENASGPGWCFQRERLFPFFLSAAGPVLLIGCPQWWLRHRFSPSCLSQPGHPGAGTAPPAPPSPKARIHALPGAWRGLARDLPGAEGCFLFPTGNNFPGHGSPRLPIPCFHESSRVCDSGTIVGRSGVSITDPVFTCRGGFPEKRRNSNSKA